MQTLQSRTNMWMNEFTYIVVYYKIALVVSGIIWFERLLLNDLYVWNFFKVHVLYTYLLRWYIILGNACVQCTCIWHWNKGFQLKIVIQLSFLWTTQRKKKRHLPELPFSSSIFASFYYYLLSFLLFYFLKTKHHYYFIIERCMQSKKTPNLFELPDVSPNHIFVTVCIVRN